MRFKQDRFSQRKFFYGYDGNEIFQGIWNDIIFKIYIQDRIILLESHDIDEAYLFAINMPLALIAAYDEQLVLHCSCIKTNEKVIGFSGGKAIGKSTICSMLATNSRCIFSDDTICIDSKSRHIFSNNTVAKYTTKTINSLKILSANLPDSITVYRQKHIKKLQLSQGVEKLENFSIEYLFRGETFSRVNIFDRNARIELFKNNTVGYKYGSQELRAIMNNTIERIFAAIDLSSHALYIPHCDLSDPHNLLYEIEALVFSK